VIGEGTFDRLPAPARQMMLDNAFAMRAETASPPERYFPDLSPEDLIGLDTPTLLLHGELSPAMFGRITDELARVLPNATRATIPAASHGMHGQNPAAYNEALLAFLARA
jgi:pimeloyl-ACP methyl ester carboxylesterase